MVLPCFRNVIIVKKLNANANKHLLLLSSIVYRQMSRNNGHMVTSATIINFNDYLISCVCIEFRAQCVDNPAMMYGKRFITE